MKIVSISLILVAALSSVGAFANPCGVSLSGEVQMIPLDGSSIAVVSRSHPSFGQWVSPIQAEPQADGRVNLAVYETVITAMLGQKIADLGSIAFELPEGEKLCRVSWTKGSSTRVFKLISTSVNGDLILAEVANDAPALVIRKTN